MIARPKRSFTSRCAGTILAVLCAVFILAAGRSPQTSDAAEDTATATVQSRLAEPEQTQSEIQTAQETTTAGQTQPVSDTQQQTTGTTVASPPAKEETETEPRTTAAVPSVELSEFEQEVVRLVNLERKTAGLNPLQIGGQALQNAVERRALEITQSFSHTRPGGTSFDTVLAEYAVARYTTAGENLAAGQTTPEQVVAEWMDSPGHRANILNPAYTQIAVAYRYEASLHYRHYWAQLFYTPRS
ncbi:MAG: CAP domain-containing protein [Clostridiales bacterium]|nr:CAP domain-containing protein [Clostridiales bacterium]